MRRFLGFGCRVAALMAVLSPLLYAISAGQAAPPFSLVSGGGSSISLAGLRGQWVVLFFFPSATDSNSIADVKALQADLSTYDKYGTVLGISPSPKAQLAAMASQTGANFPLLSDPQSKTAQAYGVLSGGAVAPTVVLIDTKGIVNQVWTGVTPATVSKQATLTLSLKPPVTAVTPVHNSLKPPVP